MKHRVTIQGVTNSTDSAGGYTPTWANLATVWGKVKPKFGSERIEGEQQTSPLTHEIWIRYRDDISITHKERIIWGSRIFNISRVLDEEEHGRWLVIQAIEDVAT